MKINPDEVRKEVLAWLETRPDVTRYQLCHYTTMSGAAGMQFLQGKTRMGQSENVAKEFLRVLELARRGDILAPGDGKVIAINAGGPVRRRRIGARRAVTYETETMRRVWASMDYASANASIALITGPYGSGKTHAAQAWMAKHAEDAAYIELDEFSATGVVNFLDSLAEALGADEGKTQTQYGGIAFRRMVARLNEEPRMLVLDQCETCRLRVLQVIRQIWDRTRQAGVAVVMLSAPEILVRMTHGRSPGLGALHSRIGAWATVEGVSRQEMAAILKREGITDVDDRAFGLWHSAIRGSMRWLMASIDLVKSQHAGKPVREKTVMGFARHLMGMAIPARAGSVARDEDAQAGKPVPREVGL